MWYKQKISCVFYGKEQLSKNIDNIELYTEMGTKIEIKRHKVNKTGKFEQWVYILKGISLFLVLLINIL